MDSPKIKKTGPFNTINQDGEALSRKSGGNIFYGNKKKGGGGLDGGED